MNIATGTRAAKNRRDDQLASRARRPRDLLDAAANVVREDASHVPQARCSHLAGELNGTSRQNLHHEAAEVVYQFLRYQRHKKSKTQRRSATATFVLRPWSKAVLLRYQHI